jgi:hypothetical protein
VLAAACGSHDAHHAGAACLLVVATVIIGRGCGLLKVLLAPLPTALGSLPGIMESDVGRCLPTVALGHVELGRLAAGGVLGDHAA